MARDWLVEGLLLAFAVGLFAYTAKRSVASDLHFRRQGAVASIGVTLLTLVMVVGRWDYWMIFYRRSSLYEASADLPAWMVCLLILAIMVPVDLVMLRRAGS